MLKWRRLAGAILLLGLITTQMLSACAPGAGTRDTCFSPSYEALLARLPKDDQGAGLEEYFDGPAAQQPMTYALALSAETLHFRICQDDSARSRIRAGVKWLVDNADLDNDGRIGWGLPNAWDAFSDGTTNPPNQPYAITTALVFQGLEDALALPSFWTEAERTTISDLLARASVDWCRDAWTEQDRSSGYFWYSSSSDDAFPVYNTTAMLLGSLMRFVSEHGDALSASDRDLVVGRIDSAARGVISGVAWRTGLPFWNYIAVPNTLNHDGPNDLVHHCYILWGMELYRFYGGRVLVPWSTAQATASLQRFRKDGVIHAYPQDVAYEESLYRDRPSKLWGTGMLIAFEARWGDLAEATWDIKRVERDYGPIPNLKLYPPRYSQDDTFYARHAVHVLWGIALHDAAADRVTMEVPRVSPTPRSATGYAY